MTDRSFSVDVSYFQRTVNWLYSRVWFIFRCTFGAGFVDPNFAANFAWACKNVNRRRPFRRTLRGFTIYTVYLPGNDVVTAVKNAVEAAAARYSIADPWKWVTVNVDIETWRGKSYEIHGDHSEEIVGVLNGFTALIADRAAVPVAAAQRRVVCYGNTGDLAVVFPRLRPAWLWWKIAKYSDTPPVWPQMWGWQYTDGSSKYPVPDGYPTRSAPFGHCDHDVLFFSGDGLANHFYGELSTPDLLEEIMAFYPDKAAFEAAIKGLVHDELVDAIGILGGRGAAGHKSGSFDPAAIDVAGVLERIDPKHKKAASK